MDNFDNNFNGFNQQVPPPFEKSVIGADVSSVMRRVYGKMFLALLVTAASSFVMLANPSISVAIFSSKIAFWGIMFGELGLVIWLSAAINRLSNGMATLLFYAYSVLNGIVLTTIFYVYTPSSILLTFCTTAGVFGAMTIFGYVTKQDLSKIGSILFMALIGLIICMLVNIFLKSSAMDWLISFAGVAIFVGLTAWDTQKVKRMAEMSDETAVSKLATIGALQLYLDFINMFLYLLRIFGRNS
jgi:FtsH-binding integral membrane protein